MVFFNWAIPIALAIGLFFGGFVYWRKIKYDSGYDEKESMNGFLLSLLVGYLAGRIFFIILNFSQFGWHPWHWLNLINYPGMIEIISLFVSGVFLKIWCLKHKLDAWQILDFWITAASLTLVFYQIGKFFNGVGFGYETSLPWGITYSGVVIPHHPAQLYLAIFYLLLFIYLIKVEYTYRTFDWYRHGRSAASSGFLIGSGLIAFSLVSILSLLISPAQFPFWSWISLDLILYLIILFLGIRIIWIRSGRKFLFRSADTTKKDNKTIATSAPLELGSANEQINVGLTVSHMKDNSSAINSKESSIKNKKTNIAVAQKVARRSISQSFVNNKKKSSPPSKAKKSPPTKFKMK